MFEESNEPADWSKGFIGGYHAACKQLIEKFNPYVVDDLLVMFRIMGNDTTLQEIVAKHIVDRTEPPF